MAQAVIEGDWSMRTAYFDDKPTLFSKNLSTFCLVNETITYVFTEENVHEFILPVG